MNQSDVPSSLGLWFSSSVLVEKVVAAFNVAQGKLRKPKIQLQMKVNCHFFPHEMRWGFCDKDPALNDQFLLFMSDPTQRLSGAPLKSYLPSINSRRKYMFRFATEEQLTELVEKFNVHQESLGLLPVVIVKDINYWWLRMDKAYGLFIANPEVAGRFGIFMKNNL